MAVRAEVSQSNKRREGTLRVLGISLDFERIKRNTGVLL